MTPIKDYVGRSKPTMAFKRLKVVLTIFIVPLILTVWFGLTAPVGEFLWFAFIGFTMGYVLTALATYTFNAIKSFIKGESNGI
tara:strand:- start:459 stop:707 length:249 start_codon:yes stop_codon:yes gene_type:complete